MTNYSPINKPKTSLSPQKFALFLSIGAVIMIAIVAITVFFIAQPKRVDTASQQTTTTTTLREKLTAAKTLERAKQYFKGTEVVKSSLSIPVKAEGYKFYSIATDPAQTKSAAATLTKTEAARNVASLEHMLEYDQFERTIVSDGANDGAYLADFTRSDVTCQISNTATDKNKPDIRFVEFKCLDASDYKNLAKEQLPLYNAYSPAASSSYDIGIVGTMSVRDSKYAGYHLAEIPVGSVLPHQYTPLGTALFYQSPDGRWNFFKVRQNETLTCDTYKGTAPSKVDLRLIYQGEACRDLNKGVITVVEAPKNNK